MPTKVEIREVIDRKGCDLFAFFERDAGADPQSNDRCFIHSISNRDTELLAVDIRREDASAVSGLMTSLLSSWESKPVRPGETCLAMGCNLMVRVIEAPAEILDEIMHNVLSAAVDYRGNKDFSVLILVPARRLTDREVGEIATER